jgi:cob(I)alamin adenosyltransferase
MGDRLTSIYTRGGDAGRTGLANGQRVEKTSLRIEAIGTVDELNSAIGVVLAYPIPAEVKACLGEVQQELFDLGGELSMPGAELLQAQCTQRLEHSLDEFNSALPTLKEFILPGGGLAASSCHLARAICRRAERRIIALGQSEPINEASRTYLNRLSDLLFVVCRVLARHAGEQEVYWRGTQ